MSNPIRYDELLVRHLAAELDARLAGGRAAAIRLDPDARRAALELESGALVFELHATRGDVRLGAPPAAPKVIPLRRRSVLRAVGAPPDERRLVLSLAGTGSAADRPRTLVVELMTNQWNLLALDRNGRILDAVWRRTAGGRALRRGAVYVAPPSRGRRGADEPIPLEEWLALLGPVAPAERARRLVEAVAWTSPINAGAILGEAGGGSGGPAAALEAGYRRYVEVTTSPGTRPVILATAKGPQPYPVPLPGLDATPCDSLLAALAEAAGAPAPEEAVPAGAVSPELLERLRRRLRRAEARADRLAAELDAAAPEAARLRSLGDLLLAHLHRIPKGADRVELPDFAGETVGIELDPSLPAAENATKLYDAARKRERAAQRVPGLIATARKEAASLRALLERAGAGEADEAEVREAVGDVGPPAAGRAAATPDALPFRRYRTSGGLEVRVGRTGRANDELTFHHSSPDDVWLHARDAAGAHVILRWTRGDENPPARDLHEAAVLAAVHSRSRTSGVAAVDWTRRKYVRKPRKAPPGRVIVERVKTLFVEPDEALERRLRAEG